jgi:hypothetical protein
VSIPREGGQRPAAGRHRRRLLGSESISGGGWLYADKRATRWDGEDDLFASALSGGAAVDLTDTQRTPAEIGIDAWAIRREVDVTVAEATHVDLSGGGSRSHLTNEVPAVSAERRKRLARIHGHTALTDVTVCVADPRN